MYDGAPTAVVGGCSNMCNTRSIFATPDKTLAIATYV
jgi:hypothetical protein